MQLGSQSANPAMPDRQRSSGHDAVGSGQVAADAAAAETETERTTLLMQAVEITWPESYLAMASSAEVVLSVPHPENQAPATMNVTIRVLVTITPLSAS